MIIYYQGAELPTYRNHIINNGIQSSSLSYLGLRKRTKFTKPWLVKDKFPEGHHLFVDSGCQTLNNAKEQQYTNAELREIADHYYQWVGQNIDSIELFSEFDALQLGAGYLEEARSNFHELFYDKVLPVWNGTVDSIGDLRDLGERFGRVGISQTVLNGRDLIPTLNRMVVDGVQLHGLAMTKPDIMQAVKWTSVSSTSWTTPQRYGDTIIWSHNQLKRYPKSMKDQARKKERSVFLANGFDVDKIAADDPKELLKISLWSWEQLANKINKNTRGVTAPMNYPDEGFTSEDYDGVGGEVETVRQRVPTATPRHPSQMTTIPFLDFDFDTNKVKNKETGIYEDVEIPKLKIRSESMRICDTCFLASKCPKFEEGSTCAYNIPIVIRTKEQMTALMDSMVEMQAQRVLFMKMAEDAEGGYADPNLSSEIDRLSKLMKTKHEMEQEGFSLTVTAKQNGQSSMVERIFGDVSNVKPLGELPQARQVEDAFEEYGFIDAEVVDLPDYGRSNGK